MFALNIILAALGVVISLGAAIFWLKARRMLRNNIRMSSSGTINENIHTYHIISWLYSHKSKFEVILIAIVTMIEFFALIPF